MGDIFASLFVGFILLEAYKLIPAGSWLPVGIGFLVPMAVYSFSCYWNRCGYDMARAIRTSLVMGGFFWIVHWLPIPVGFHRASGFVAPLIVSWWARHGQPPNSDPSLE